MSQTVLEFVNDLALPQGAVPINRRAWFRDLDGIRAVFVDQTPFYCYPLDDQILHRFCAIQLVEAGVAKVNEASQAFDLHLRNFSRWRSKFRQLGIAGLFPEKSGPKSIRTPTLAAGIVQLYRKGKSSYGIAAQLGISDSTVRRILKEQGVPLRTPFDNHQPLPLTDDDGELQQPSSQAIEPQVIEATSIPYASPLDLAFTALGLIEEAPVEFQSADGVPNAGALLGLALLEETHLLEEARAVYSRLENGWYGLRSLVWTLVVMALVRIKRPEQIKHHDPAGLGRVLGLPRAAEVKTIRRKLNEIAERGPAAQWHRRLARRRAEQQPSALATLYVDGHVRAYHGRHRIGKTHVSRLKRVLRAETDYWVHQAHGQQFPVASEVFCFSVKNAAITAGVS